MNGIKNSIKLKKLVDTMKLTVIHKSSNYEDIEIDSMDVNRPGLQLSGYMDGFPYKRIQIIGRVEYNYMLELDDKIQYERFRGVLSYDVPCVIFSYGMTIPKDIIDLADYYDKTLLLSKMSTTKLISKLNQTLELFLSERTSVHGELLDIYGMGVLITGKSSVGKSETSLDLVTRGHRLVADDMVDIVAYDNKLIGKSPENIRHYMELRGIGIIDVRRLYGIGSVKAESEIGMQIKLETWDENFEYDRLGLDEHYTNILGIKIPEMVVPVRAGRNLALIIETAVRNQRAKNLGYNSAVELINKLKEERNNI